MNRRSFLALSGAVGLAGCADQLTSAIGTWGSADGGPRFEVISFDIPERAPVGERFSYSFRVKNVGSRRGTFETGISARTGERDWRTLVESWSASLAPGEYRLYPIGEATGQYVATMVIRIDATGVTRAVPIVPASLAFGRPYATPWGDEVLADRIEVAHVYYWGGHSGREHFEQPETGRKWAFLHVTATNRTDAPNQLPAVEEFAIEGPETGFDPISIRKREGRYRPGRVEPGVARTGWICFDVPQELGAGDLAAVWRRSGPDGDVSVRWTPP